MWRVPGAGLVFKGHVAGSSPAYTGKYFCWNVRQAVPYQRCHLVWTMFTFFTHCLQVLLCWVVSCVCCGRWCSWSRNYQGSVPRTSQEIIERTHRKCVVWTDVLFSGGLSQRSTSQQRVFLQRSRWEWHGGLHRKVNEQSWRTALRFHLRESSHTFATDTWTRDIFSGRKKFVIWKLHFMDKKKSSAIARMHRVDYCPYPLVHRLVQRCIPYIVWFGRNLGNLHILALLHFCTGFWKAKGKNLFCGPALGFAVKNNRKLIDGRSS